MFLVASNLEGERIMKRYLLTPGPTPVPEECLSKMAEPIIHHRTPAYVEMNKVALEKLKKVFYTDGDIMIFVSSGTGAMEGAVVNTIDKGDKAIVVRSGKFGERWGELIETYSGNPVYIDLEWGKKLDPQLITDLLNENPDTKAVFTTLTETSTGIVYPIKEIGEIVSKTDALLVIDAISGLGGQEFYMDEWKVDITVAGSQKGLMLPPGQAYAAVNEKAWKVIKQKSRACYYFNWAKYLKSQVGAGKDPYTGAVSHTVALLKALEIIEKEGMEKRFQRCKILAEACRSAVKALGLELFAETPCDVVTAVKVPEEIDGKALVKKLRDEYGVTIAGGQAHLAGKIFRIAHMGYIERFDIIVAISALEMVLAELGYEFEMGVGVAAAQKILAKEYI